MEEAAEGALNGVVRGRSVALTQAILGASPLTAGIGLVVAPDVVMLLSQQDQLSEEAFTNEALGVAGKGASATALACANGKASEQAGASRARGF